MQKRVLSHTQLKLRVRNGTNLSFIVATCLERKTTTSYIFAYIFRMEQKLARMVAYMEHYCQKRKHH